MAKYMINDDNNNLRTDEESTYVWIRHQLFDCFIDGANWLQFI
jgi:hypothetical protein